MKRTQFVKSSNVTRTIKIGNRKQSLDVVYYGRVYSKYILDSTEIDLDLFLKLHNERT